LRDQTKCKGENMNIEDFELISLVNPKEDPYFSWYGCDVIGCEAHNIGATVYDCQGYETLEANPEGNLCKFQLCGDCLYEYHYGERPEV
jgi:hypothetical protein